MSMVKRIEELCTKENITIAELERKMNFGNSTIRKWDKSFPSVDKVMKVAEYFHVGMDYLYSGKKEIGGDIAARKFEELSGLEKKAVEHLIDFYISQKSKTGE